MKKLVFASLLLVATVSFGQGKKCSTLWLGQPYDSIQTFQQMVEQYLDTKMKMVPGEGDIKTIYEMKDEGELGMMKVWMKGKKVASGGTIVTTYVTSSYKVVGVADKIESLMAALKDMVADCTTSATDMAITYAGGKITLEKQGGDWSKKNLAMYTLTLTSTR